MATTAGAKKGLWSTIRRIAASDRISGLIMLGFALTGLVLANLPATAHAFETVAETHLFIPYTNLDLPIGHWAQDGLLTIFFLTVGLELKQELTTGSLANPKAAAVPMLCAVGGMIAPPILFLAVTALFSQIGPGEPGTLILTTIATASRVLNGSTRKVRNQSYVKVMEAATKLNYRPNAYAQAVAKGTAPNIVLLVSDISDPYFASVSQGVVKAAAERGISVTIGVATTPHEELEAVRKSVSTRPRGIIISESEYTDAPERQALQTELTQYEASGGRAVFVLNRSLPFPAVDVANDVGARAIAKLIVDSGYTRPAILKGDDAHRSSKERLAGVMEVLDEAGITVDPKAVANGKFSRTDGYAAVMQMARSGLLKPGEGALYNGKGIDSIIALNDVMAIGAMTALRANGIEPGREIGVTGFGDIPYSADVFPPLTTVHLPLAEMGQAAADSILSNRDDAEATGGTANRLIYVQSAPDVVLRGSLPHR